MSFFLSTGVYFKFGKCGQYLTSSDTSILPPLDPSKPLDPNLILDVHLNSYGPDEGREVVDLLVDEFWQGDEDSNREGLMIIGVGDPRLG